MLATQNEIAAIYDIVTGQKIREMKPVVSNNYAKNRATFDPSDELVSAHQIFPRILNLRNLSYFIKFIVCLDLLWLDFHINVDSKMLILLQGFPS